MVVNERPLAIGLGDRARGRTRSMCVRTPKLLTMHWRNWRPVNGAADQRLRIPAACDVHRDPARLVADGCRGRTQL